MPLQFSLLSYHLLVTQSVKMHHALPQTFTRHILHPTTNPHTNTHVLWPEVEWAKWDVTRPPLLFAIHVISPYILKGLFWPVCHVERPARTKPVFAVWQWRGSRGLTIERMCATSCGKEKDIKNIFVYGRVSCGKTTRYSAIFAALTVIDIPLNFYFSTFIQLQFMYSTSSDSQSDMFCPEMGRMLRTVA